MASEAPRLSVVLPVDRTESGAETIDALRSQAAAVPIELVLVGLDGRPPTPPSGADDFAALQLLAHGGSSLSSARVDGVHAASAPYVVMAETHSFPRPGWARALVERLDEGWVGVGPAIEPANPARRAVALTFFDYGRWMSGPEGSWPDLPGHNSAYRRDAALAVLREDPDALDSESVMQERLRGAGGELYLDLRARTGHMNVEGFAPAAREWVEFSRVFAARRAAEWGPPRRALYAIGSPLLPLIRFRRYVVAARRNGYLPRLLRGIDMLVVTLVASAYGELLGYATGRCDPAATREFELHRRRWAPSAPPAQPEHAA